MPVDRPPLPEGPSTPPAPARARQALCRLPELGLRTGGRVASVRATPGSAPDIVERLAELGFLPGEPVRILARAPFGDPLAVRIGSGTFALRLAEAACIEVRPLPASR